MTDNEKRINEITAAFDRMCSRMDSRRDPFGKATMSKGAERRLCAVDRADAIATLGWEPEPENAPAGERYAARTGELWTYLLEERKKLEQLRCAGCPGCGDGR